MNPCVLSEILGVPILGAVGVVMSFRLFRWEKETFHPYWGIWPYAEMSKFSVVCSLFSCGLPVAAIPVSLADHDETAVLLMVPALGTDALGSGKDGIFKAFQRQSRQNGSPPTSNRVQSKL